MAILEPGTPAALRKSRHISMMKLRDLSQVNLASNEEDDAKFNSEGLLRNENYIGSLDYSHDGHEGHEGHGHHHAHLTTAKEAMVKCVSALYGKLLVMIGIGFPIAKGLSPNLSLIYYNSFYLYLYFGSILFIIFAYVSLLSSFTVQVNNVIMYFREIRGYIKPFKSTVESRFQELKKKFDKSTENHFVEHKNESLKSGYSSSTESEGLGLADIEEGSVREKRSKFVYTENAGHGSMYLKMGTIVFGIGSMIYSGLEFAHYFELKSDCKDILMAITPSSRMIFTFLQMYFIFLNSRVSISRHTTIARFGLMHMVATNLCIWLNVLVEETKHTIHHVKHEQHHADHEHNHGENDHGANDGGHIDDHHHAATDDSQEHEQDDHDSDHEDDHDDHEEEDDDSSSVEIFDENHLPLSSELLSDLEYSEEAVEGSSIEAFTSFSPSVFEAMNAFNITSFTTTSTTTLDPDGFNLKLADGVFDSQSSFHNLVKRSVDEHEGCRIVNLMGDMVSSSAPLLFPCTIEYSLLCASVLYVMWKNVQVRKSMQLYHNDHHRQLSQLIARKVRHLYSVDCGKASRGLFSGIFVLVWTLISLIVFYVLISESHFKYYGILSANISEIILYSIGIIATIIGMKQIRNLGFIEEEETELDNVLLVIAQVGLYMFTICTLIGGYFSSLNVSALTLITALVILVQASLQTLYILDGSRRCCKTPDHIEKKYGRDMVTFMLTLNLSMWLFSTFQTSRSYLHKAQQEFYGIWAWTIISHISMPLAIFYRFHATVCLGEVWKRAYKIRNEDDF